jgi:O-antigen/teichoic acid export membrane protein
MSLPRFFRLLGERARQLAPRDFGVLAGANLASQLISFVAMPLLTRWCAVADFGIFQLYATTITVSGLLACARYDQAVLVAPDDGRARALTLLAVGIALLAGGLAGGLAGFAGSAGGGWLELAAWAPLVGAAVFLTGATTATTQWQVRRANFTAISRSRLVQSICTVGVQLGAASAGHGGPGLIVGDAIGRAAGLLALVGLARLPARVSLAPPVPWRQLAREYGRFPLISTPSALLNATGFALPVVVLEHYFGPRAVGVFSLLERVMGIPTVLLGQPLSQLFSHQFRSALTAGGSAPRAAINHTLRTAALLGGPIYATLLAGGPFLFTWVFGPQWRPAGQLAQLLVLPYFLGYLVWPIMPALIILNRLRTQLAWDVARALLMLGTLAMVGRWSDHYEHGVVAAISVMTVMYAVHFLFTVRAAGRHES